MNKYKPALRYGLWMALTNIVFFLLIYAIDPGIIATMGGWIMNTVVVLLAVPIVFMVLGARDCKPNFSPYTFLNAFGAAMTVAVISALVVMVFQIVFTELIDPSYEQNLKEMVSDKAREYMESQGVEQEIIDERISDTEAKFEQNEGFMGKLRGTAFGLVWYLILALIIGAVQKEKKEDQVDLIA